MEHIDARVDFLVSTREQSPQQELARADLADVTAHRIPIPSLEEGPCAAKTLFVVADPAKVTVLFLLFGNLFFADRAIRIGLNLLGRPVPEENFIFVAVRVLLIVYLKET